MTTNGCDVFYGHICHLLMNTNSHVTFPQCYQMQKGIKSDFCSFLILPIQRIPRYKMLLSEILCNTPEDHVEYSSLQKAVNEIEKIASYINEQKRNFDNVRYMYEVYGMIDSIYPGFVQPNRKFLRKGSLNVRYR